MPSLSNNYYNYAVFISGFLNTLDDIVVYKYLFKRKFFCIHVVKNINVELAKLCC